MKGIYRGVEGFSLKEAGALGNKGGEDFMEGLKEGLRVITLASITGVSVFEGIIDKGRVNRIRGDLEADEIGLSLFSHPVRPCFWN